MTLFSTAAAVGRALTSAPGIPMARVTALRRAFDAILQDPGFLADAKRSRTDINPLTGEKLQELVNSLVHAPKDVIARAQQLAKP